MLSHDAIYESVYRILFNAYGADYLLLKKDLTFEELAERITQEIVRKQAEMAAA